MLQELKYIIQNFGKIKHFGLKNSIKKYVLRIKKINSQKNQCIIFNAGGTGNNWIHSILLSHNDIGVSYGFQIFFKEYGYTQFSFYKDIEKNLAAFNLCNEMQSIMAQMPIDINFDVLKKVAPNKKSYALLHLHNSSSLLKIKHKYGLPKKIKLLYVYGHPLKRFKAVYKIYAVSLFEANTSLQHLTDRVKLYKSAIGIINKTEKHFNIDILNTEAVISALCFLEIVYDVVFDIEQALKIKNCKKVYFEEIKSDPILLDRTLRYITNNQINFDSDWIESIIKNENLGRGIQIDNNNKIIKSESTIQAVHSVRSKINFEKDFYELFSTNNLSTIWDNLEKWEQYLFKELAKHHKKFSYVYKKLNNIDMSFMQ